ncbi:PepSY-associated TM helix domain-containing protein [Xanthobacter flavus]|uniref:PepSY-associated TM helix domain-containing protein n=1 Tax=Xanthobacter flavus TaxID=281 RepID=UPI003726F8C2
MSPGTKPAPAKRFTLRPALVWAHRILGLSTALFLVIAGLTGSVLAFHHELDEWLNPSAYRATAVGTPLSPDALARAVEAGHPDFRVWYLSLPHEAGEAAEVAALGRIDPATGEPVPIPADTFLVDPVSGEVLAARLWGACCFSALKIMPFLYELHHNLSLPGIYGTLLMGGVALLWLVDGFIGFALTLPRGRPFLTKWRSAFTIKGGSAFRLNIDLHRAAGLWLFVVLIALALSSVAMNLRQEVVEPVVGLFSKLTPTPFSGGPLAPLRERTLSFDTVLEAGLKEARGRGWQEPAGEIFYSPHYGVFGVAFGDHDDPMDRRWLYFDGATGAFRSASLPGVGTAGDVFIQLQFPIHSGRVFGLAGRIIIAVMGVVIAGLAITGVAVWWMKRKGRVGRKGKARTAQAGTGKESRARAKAMPAE